MALIWHRVAPITRTILTAAVAHVLQPQEIAQSVRLDAERLPWGLARKLRGSMTIGLAEPFFFMAGGFR
jgi:hypothetical protein